jgi:hypothetical protein
MPLISVRCPNCGWRCSDLWRVERNRTEWIEYLICRACAFDFARIVIVDPSDVVPFSPSSDTTFYRPPSSDS